MEGGREGLRDRGREGRRKRQREYGSIVGRMQEAGIDRGKDRLVCLLTLCPWVTSFYRIGRMVPLHFHTVNKVSNPATVLFSNIKGYVCSLNTERVHVINAGPLCQTSGLYDLL